MKVYDSIDFMPIWNWNQVIETGDHRYCLELPSYKTLPETDIDCKAAWDELQEEKINEFGLNNRQKDMFFKRRRLETMRIEFIARDFYLTHILSFEKSSDAFKICLEKLKIFGIDTDKILLAKEWKSYVRSLIDKNNGSITRIKILIKDIEGVEKTIKASKITLRKQAAILQQKFTGVDFNIKTMPVSKWFTYLQLYNEQ